VSINTNPPPALDTTSFAQTLEILRSYPHTPKTVERLKTDSQLNGSKLPAPARRPVLKIIAWATLIIVWLFAFLMLLAIRQPVLGLLLLFIGPILVLLLRNLIRRRLPPATPPSDTHAAPGQRLNQTVSSPPPVHTATDTSAALQPDTDPHEDHEYQPAADVYPLRPETPPVSPRPASRSKRVLIFTVSLALYAAVAVEALPNLTTTWIVLTVLLHEVGHFVAMWLRGYSNLNMFFIPFIAGAVSGSKKNATPADELIMLLAGPAPGLLLGCLLYWLDNYLPLTAARQFALWLVALNLLNLLPIWPLDGGRIGWLLFARQSAAAQACLSACSFVGLCFLFLAPQGGTTFLIVMAFLLIWWLPPRYHHARSALEFFNQFPGAPAELKELSELQLWKLYWLAEPASPNTRGVRAMEMMKIYSRVTLLPRSPAGLKYLLAFLLLWLIALATATGTRLQLDARDTSAALGTLFDSLLPR